MFEETADPDDEDTWPVFGARFQMPEGEWYVSLRAIDHDDAERRVRYMRRNLELVGQFVEETELSETIH